MAAWTNSPRIALYSHDTYGLGHLTRTTRVAWAVSRALPGSSVLILTGSPIAHRFAFPSGVDYVKLPSVVKQGLDQYGSRELAISPRRIRRMRSRIITDTLDTFRPNLLLVDNVPLGMKGELLPALERQRARNRDVQIHLNLRDILDDPDVIRQSWSELGVPEVLDRIYDAIHVFGAKSVFDSIAAYDLPPDKTEMLGYIRPPDGTGAVPAPRRGGRRRVLATIGGGGDGAEILAAAVEMQRAFGDASPYDLTVVTGPLMEPSARTRLEEACRGVRGITLHDYVEDLPAHMERFDLVLSMGGYNTMCEVMARARRSVVIPRMYPRREQEIRARALERRGLIRVIEPREINPAKLSRTLREMLLAGPQLSSGRCPSLDGLPFLQRRLRKLLDGRIARRRSPSVSSLDRSARATSETSSDPDPDAGTADQGSSSHSNPARTSVRP